MTPVILDSSVASIFFRRRRSDLTLPESRVRMHTRDLLARGEARLTWPVLQEVLSGVRCEATFEELVRNLRAVHTEPATRFDYERAARFCNQCLDAGVAVSYLNLLICAVSERLDLPIYTLDADFQRYSELLGIQLYDSEQA